MKKLIILTVALMVGSVFADDTVTYVKNPDGTIQAITIFKDVNAVSDKLGDLSGQLNQIDQKIQQAQDALIALTQQRAAVQAELDSLISAQK